MSGVSVGNDPGPSLNLNVLSELLGTSASVAARIQQFQEAKAAADASLKALGLGKDAQQALAEANAVLEDAKAQREATKAAADAAIKNAADAAASARAIIDDAHAQAALIRSQVQSQREAHEATAKRVMDELNSERSALAAQRADCTAAQERVAAAQARAEQALKEAKDAKDKAKAAEADFKRQAAALQAALTNVTK